MSSIQRPPPPSTLSQQDFAAMVQAPASDSRICFQNYFFVWELCVAWLRNLNVTYWVHLWRETSHFNEALWRREGHIAQLWILFYALG